VRTVGLRLDALLSPEFVKPKLNHRFTFCLKGGGLINVYLIRTERNSNVVMVTWYNGEFEEPYAVSAIDNANVAMNVLYDAAERFQQLHPDKPTRSGSSLTAMSSMSK